MHPLDAITVRSPCTVAWDSMSGDAQVRFCGQCRKHVYDLSAMSRADAEALVERREDTCVRYYRRADGTVATADCGARSRSLARLAVAGLTLVALGFAGKVLVQAAPTVPGKLDAAKERAADEVRDVVSGTPVETALEAVGVLPPAPKLMGAIAAPVMGKMAVPHGSPAEEP